MRLPKPFAALALEHSRAAEQHRRQAEVDGESGVFETLSAPREGLPEKLLR